MRFSSKILKRANNKVTVALSMGYDSLAIAAFLQKNYPKIELSCIHVNHNLRSQNNIMEERARQFCDDFNIPLTTHKLAQKTDGGVRSEAELRSLRYDAMAGQGYVITGHHLDDAVENYLFNCLNGVPHYLPIPLVTEYPGRGLVVIRPFILSEKADFIKFVDMNNLTKYVVEDETNTDQSYRRNWLRHDLIPNIGGHGYNLATIVKKRYNDYLLKM